MDIRVVFVLTVLSATTASDPRWLTQEEIANIARFVYGLHNDPGELQPQHPNLFEVVGSVTQLEFFLSGSLDSLRSGLVSSITLIVNLNEDHWVSMVLTRGEGRRLLVFYADSLGGKHEKFPRPDAGESEQTRSRNNAVVVSYARIRTVLTNVEQFPEVAFEDVSSRQQTDTYSCGIYALENAYRMTETVRSGNVDPEAVAASLREPVNLPELRRRYSTFLDGGSSGGIGASEESRPGEEYKTENEENELLQDVPDLQEDDIDAVDAEVDQDVNEEDLPGLVAKFKKDKSVSNLLSVQKCYLLHERSPDSEAFQLIWGALNNFSTLPCTDEKEKRDVFEHTIEVMEEEDDPELQEKDDSIPAQFFHDVTALARRTFGEDDIISVKLWLLDIFFTDTSVRDFVESGGASFSRLRTLFPGLVPNPQTGTHMDDNIDEDGLRCVRYFYVLALICRHRGRCEFSKVHLQLALNWSMETVDDPIFIRRRGSRPGRLDVLKIQLRILEELTELNQYLDLPQQAICFAIQYFSLELQNKKLLHLGPSYAAYLRFLVAEPGFTGIEIKKFLTRSLPIPVSKVKLLTLFLRARGSLIRNANLHEALLILEVGIQYLQGSYQSSFKKELYQLNLERLKSFAAVQPENALEANVDFVSRLRMQNLESESDENYIQAFRRIIDDLSLLPEEPLDFQKQNMFRAVSEFLINHYEMDRNSPFQRFLSDLYEFMARNYYNFGYIPEFLGYMAFGIVQESLFGKKLPRDESLERKMMRVLEQLKSVLISHANDADSSEYQTVSELIFGPNGIVAGLLVLSNLSKMGSSNSECGRVASLQSLSCKAWRRSASYEPFITFIREILQTVVIVRALAEVKTRLEAANESFSSEDDVER